MKTPLEGRSKDGIQTFPEFMEVFGLEEGSGYTQEEKADDIAEAYAAEQRVFAAFGALPGFGNPSPPPVVNAKQPGPEK